MARRKPDLQDMELKPSQVPRAAEFLKNGNLQGFSFWQDIAVKVHSLQAQPKFVRT
jgi:hypothetical protein